MDGDGRSANYFSRPAIKPLASSSQFANCVQVLVSAGRPVLRSVTVEGLEAFVEATGREMLQLADASVKLLIHHAFIEDETGFPKHLGKASARLVFPAVTYC
jgi:hypothetical protein